MKNLSRFSRYSRLALGELLFAYDRLIFKSEQPTSKRLFNLLQAKTGGVLRLKRPLSYPIALQLEPTIQCQLDCPECPRIKAIEGLPLGHMEWNSYEKLMLEVGPCLTAIAFWQWGEPLLHPRIADMIKLADSYGIITFISTNCQIDMSDAEVHALADSGLDMIIISMDGATQEVYESFRAGGQLSKLKQFVGRLREYKVDSKNERLKINVRVVATIDNEKEIEKIREFAVEAGADIFSVKSVSLYYDDSPDNPVLPEKMQYRSYQYQNKNTQEEYKKMPNHCYKPWQWPTLRYDGTLLFCECDHQMTAALGNVFTDGSFKAVWQGEKARKLRSAYGSDGIINLEFCQRCRYKLDDAMRIVDIL